MTALIIGLQPVITALIMAFVFSESVNPLQWAGIALGFIGLILVVAHKLFSIQTQFGATQIAYAIAGLIGLTVGTIYQKKFCSKMNLFTGTFLQYCAATVAASTSALIAERPSVTWCPTMFTALAWLVFPLSIGAIMILAFLIKRGNISKIASMFYFVPPLTALWSIILFDERLNLITGLGMIVAIIGIYLVVNDEPIVSFRRFIKTGSQTIYQNEV